jgi:predicted RNA-binding Zn-ribbon protein involved in translation (DUF1610 family)
MKIKAKIVFIDLENSPSLGWTWGPKWETSIIEFQQDWHLLSFAYKWVGEKTVHVKGLCDYPGFEKNKTDDKRLVADLWKIFDEADVVIAHNADRFDIKKANTRFVTHGFPPPSPYRTVDTLKVARKYFRFDSNKLDDLGQYLGVGRKLKHIGFALWLQCMEGDKKSWAVMKKYNQKDISLLESVYYLLRAWATNHPNINQGGFACPTCGSVEIQKRGWTYTPLRQKRRFQCQSCAAWFSGPAITAEKAQ